MDVVAKMQCTVYRDGDMHFVNAFREGDAMLLAYGLAQVLARLAVDSGWTYEDLIELINRYHEGMRYGIKPIDVAMCRENRKGQADDGR